MQKEIKDDFSRLLLKWDLEQNGRQMPWKGERDPYKIWLSEIILQQTKVEQGWEYYNRFIQNYPDIQALANAPEQEIFKLWEGLGYYSRCRNLIATAKYISHQLKGRFPADYDSILSLKGIGPYTAAAISSFAFNLPYAVVDGNVYRVLSRIFGIDIPVDSSKGKIFFAKMANELMDLKSPGAYNQALMDFGATICRPVSPICNDCVFREGCSAFKTRTIERFPVKEKKIKIKTRWFFYVLAEYDKHIVIRKRTGKDIWKDLYEFPMFESATEVDEVSLLKQVRKNNWLNGSIRNITPVSVLFKQQLSHQLIKAKFVRVEIKKKTSLPPGMNWVDKEKLGKYPFPRLLNRYLEMQRPAADS